MKHRTCSFALWLFSLLLFSFGCGVENNEPPQTTVAAPLIYPEAGTYSSALDVTMTTTTSGATIRYTTDGSTPTTTSGTVYAAPVHIADTLTLKAVAYRSGLTTSSVTSAQYTIAPLVTAPAFSPATRDLHGPAGYHHIDVHVRGDDPLYDGRHDADRDERHIVHGPGPRRRIPDAQGRGLPGRLDDLSW